MTSAAWKDPHNGKVGAEKHGMCVMIVECQKPTDNFKKGQSGKEIIENRSNTLPRSYRTYKLSSFIKPRTLLTRDYFCNPRNWKL